MVLELLAELGQVHFPSAELLHQFLLAPVVSPRVHNRLEIQFVQLVPDFLDHALTVTLRDALDRVGREIAIRVHVQGQSQPARLELGLRGGQYATGGRFELFFDVVQTLRRVAFQFAAKVSVLGGVDHVLLVERNGPACVVEAEGAIIEDEGVLILRNGENGWGCVSHDVVDFDLASDVHFRLVEIADVEFVVFRVEVENARCDFTIIGRVVECVLVDFFDPLFEFGLHVDRGGRSDRLFENI